MSLIHGDCLAILPDLADQSVPLILADLPYGTTDRSGKHGSRLFAWDSVIPLDALWEQYRRILTPTGTVVLTADQPFTSQLVMSNPDWFKYEWIWMKGRTTGFLTANYRPMKMSEDILVFSPAGAAAASANSPRGNMTYHPQGLQPKRVTKKNNPARLGKVLGQESHLGKNNKMLGDSTYEQKWTNYPTEVLTFPLDPGAFHPTQKPVALMDYLIRTYSNPGDLVVDNVMGSGTTGVAAVRAGRAFLGIEQDPAYFAFAAERIAAEQQQAAG